MTGYLTKLTKAVKSSHKVVIGTHIDPDCDGICSALAVAELVRKINHCTPVLFCHSPIPARYNFLLGNNLFTQQITDFDTLILVDSADITRVFPKAYGSLVKEINARVIINIDHHKSNNQFGNIAIIDENASSTCEMVYLLFKALKILMSNKLSEIVYSGIYNETGGFVYPNTTARALNVCGELVARGIKPAILVKQLNAKTVPGTLLLSRVLNTIRVRHGIGTMHLTQEMLNAHHARMADSENFISFLQAIEGVRVSVFLREENEGIRVSLRSDGIIDVNRLARKFGGGGHRLAAGTKINTSLRRAETAIFSAILEAVRKLK